MSGTEHAKSHAACRSASNNRAKTYCKDPVFRSLRPRGERSSSQTWAELHEKAFHRLGGATRVVVLDNLREGVLAPDIYDPTLNPLYRDVLAHYGAVALPCRVRDPGPVVKMRGFPAKT